MPTFNCNQSCRSGRCSCGAIDEQGVVRDGAALHVGMMFMDNANRAERKTLTMMTDSEIKNMRDSVKGMPVAQAAALPIYDNVRGLRVSGMSAPEYYALLSGAVPANPVSGRDACRSAAMRDHMIEGMRNAYQEASGSEAA